MADDKKIIIPDESRFDRFSLINWWDQNRLKAARILVVGAGALGNEILKNLALLGIGNIVVADMDRIENSNLSRSILFRESDQGKFKAEVAAKSLRDIYPHIHVTPLVANILYGVGLGIFNWADIVIAGLDNREARLAINRNCWKLNKPWIDGAIEQLSGVARVFIPPDGACYECTMSETDWKIIKLRRACAGLTRDQMLEGKVPTTPTSASVIAGIQCQEAIKILHGMKSFNGEGYVFNGVTHDSYIVSYDRKDDCLSHETFGEVTNTGFNSQSTTIRQMLQYVREKLGASAVLDFHFDIITGFSCPNCAASVPVFKPMDALSEGELICPACQEKRIPELMHGINGTEPYIDMTLAQIGIPAFDIICGRIGMNSVPFCLDGDADSIFHQ
jgi:adenylyltransferase/sulfurtransferase